MNLINRYLYRQIFLIFLMVVLLLSSLTAISELLRAIARLQNGLLPKEALFYFWLASYARILLNLWPIATLVAFTQGISQFSSERELDILMSSGISKRNLVQRMLPLILFLTLGSGILSFYLVPHISKVAKEKIQSYSHEIKAQTIPQNQLLTLDNHSSLWFSKDAEGKQRLVASHILQEPNQPIQLSIIKSSTLNTTKNATSLTFQFGKGTLLSLSKNQLNQGSFQKANLMVPRSQDAYDYQLHFTAIDNISLFKGRKDPQYWMELNLRFMNVLMVLTLSLIGIPLGILRPRQKRGAKMLPMIGIMALSVVLNSTAINITQKTGNASIFYLSQCLLLALGVYPLLREFYLEKQSKLIN